MLSIAGNALKWYTTLSSPDDLSYFIALTAYSTMFIYVLDLENLPFIYMFLINEGIGLIVLCKCSKYLFQVNYTV